MEADFDLTISGLNRDQLEELLDLITAKVDEMGGQVAGGFIDTGAGDGKES